ncbi:DUF4089 domain-containing protein [Azospirillum sp. RWY-5-1]|uniref:DUF4089 domain-containing protein n=1 Tax=Azospirillum oleiclasticum TaxID=2735135 RepID=A0ABX2T3U2_9PROT|nr:DUF4089 domain-containing protein [Azospirillum oleiclasticum]NYZ11344.1 DUF4089 domain-containing protein [Azospirillum oleiclasticum]NYZ18505.1 DUF4089 domain-containing protein [Azospirillum oleiclasticum]
MPDIDIPAYVDQAAAVIGLPIDPAHRPGVIMNFERVAGMAALVLDLPLSDTDEVAPVYVP